MERQTQLPEFMQKNNQNGNNSQILPMKMGKIQKPEGRINTGLYLDILLFFLIFPTYKRVSLFPQIKYYEDGEKKGVWEIGKNSNFYYYFEMDPSKHLG